MNQLISQFQKQAIAAAKQGDWEQSAHWNESIIEQEPRNVSALNRLGFCYIQLGKSKDATKMYQKVLEIEKLNAVAKKYLQMLDSKQGVIKQSQIDMFQDFVEEPGKTKIIQLGRLCGPALLDELSVGSRCTLKTKGRFVTVLSKQGEYIGSLPEDISLHLSQLIKTGNTYDCVIRSSSKQECSVFIKETFRSPENLHTPSFLSNKRNGVNDSDEDILYAGLMDDETVPVKEDDAVSEDLQNDNDDDSDMKETLPSDILGDVMVE